MLLQIEEAEGEQVLRFSGGFAVAKAVCETVHNQMVLLQLVEASTRIQPAKCIWNSLSMDDNAFTIPLDEFQ